MVSEAEGTERIEHKTNFFANLLSLSGHAMLRSWWLELYEAACKSNWPKAEKLYEAGLTVTIRAGVGPTVQHIVILDSIA